jgi:hypothetical protein
MTLHKTKHLLKKKAKSKKTLKKNKNINSFNADPIFDNFICSGSFELELEHQHKFDPLDEKLSLIENTSILIPELKQTSQIYFNMETEKAIIEFQEESDIEKRKQIFATRIQPSFSKLIENVIYVYKFHTIDEINTLKNDCMSALFETLHKFDKTKNCRAFSYFNVVVKNFLIQKLKTLTKKNKIDVCLDKNLLAKLEKPTNENTTYSLEKIFEKREFVELLKDECKSWRNKFQKKGELVVLESIILLLDNPDLVSIYNKKALYMYIRELTGLNTKQIVINLNKIKRKYRIFAKRYLRGDV